MSQDFVMIQEPLAKKTLMHRTQCVFNQDPDPKDDSFFEGVIEVIEGAFTDRFIFDFETEEELADGTHHLIWVDRHEQAVLTLVKEHESGICYLIIEALRAGDVRKIQRVIEDALDIASLETLQTEATQSQLQKPERLMRLALALGQRAPDATSARIFREAIKHPAPRVRQQAARSMATLRWPGFIDDLENQLKGEPDPAAFESAERALSACRQESERIVQRRA